MKFKRIGALALTVMIAGASIIGCSSNSGSGTDSTPNDQGKPDKVVELNFWDMVGGPAEYIDTAKKLVDQFNSENPTIKVTYQSTPWNNWYQTFTTAIASKTAPDISTGAGYQAFQFYDMDEILPIDDVIEEWRAEGKLKDFTEGSIDTLKYDGHYVSLPWGIDIRVPFYRADLFEAANIQPPQTWDELRAAAKQLTGDGKYGILAPGDTGGTHYLYSFMLNNGGGLFDENKKVDFMNERNVEAVKFLSDMVKDGSFNPAGAGFKGDDATKAFGQGDAAIVIKNPGFKDALPNLEGKVAVMKPLTGPHGDTGTIRWVNNIMIYKQTKHPEEAKTFLKWWSENSKALWTEGHANQLPARISFSKDDYFQNDPIYKLILDEYIGIGKTTGAKYPSAFSELNEIEGEGLMQTLMQEIILGKDPEEAMKKAEKKIKDIMNE
ncbi:sugar ABC transporter substrate-binding protein [Paenibacillaceae bacterium]|nr:sugar ABC transporter substrate-binding protein [Paenibacillaceae bacterium]